MPVGPPELFPRGKAFAGDRGVCDLHANSCNVFAFVTGPEGLRVCWGIKEG